MKLLNRRGVDEATKLKARMKRLLTSAFLLLSITTVLYAQNIKVTKFNMLLNDMTANTHGTQKLDQNGEKAALIKIQAPDHSFTFDGGSLGIVAREEHSAETWLYVPRMAKRITIQHKDYGVLRDYYYPVPIEGGRTYEMYLDIGIGRYVTVTSEIANSTIYIDGENCGKAPINNRYMSFGRHTVRAIKDRYEGEQTFMITTDDDAGIRLVRVEQRDMSDHFGEVTVNVDNNADIYFEGRKVGTSTWKTELREGTYIVETRKADCDPVKTSFTVVARQKNVFKANTPTPHTGWLQVYTRPRNVKTSPFDANEVKSLPVGTYQLEFSRSGYVTQNHEYTVRHNETTRDTVTLSRINYVKPLAFYFGAGVSLNSLMGITGILGAVFQRHDIQLHYTFGLSDSKKVHAYSNDGNDNYLSSLSFKKNSFGLKYGYQFNLMRQLAITPQLGFSVDRLSASVTSGNGLYADGASCNSITLGVKLLLVPFQHCYIFAAPEYDVPVNKDDNYKRLTEISDIKAGGFSATLGVLVNF